MLVLINFATENFRKAQKLNSWSGKHIAGFDYVYEWVVDSDNKLIDQDFYEKNRTIFSEIKGAHLWKPYCVVKTLEKLNDGDILFYCDAATFFTRNLRKYLERNVNDIWVSDIPFLEKQFSNKEAFKIVGCDFSEYGNYNQIQSGFIGIRKSDKTVNIINEWLRLCCMEKVMISLAAGNDPSFIENRDDQTALSLLCKREHIIPYPDPTQYGKLPEEYMRDPKYIFKIPKQHHERKMFIVLHRTPDVNLIICLKQLFVAIMPRKLSLKIIGIIRR